MKRFGLIGAAGYIAPRHIQAIKETGNQLIAAYDPHDSVGILDHYFPDTQFFTEYERFDRYIEKLRIQGLGLDYLVICSPNYLHDAHIRLGLRAGCHVICEKPIVLNPWNLDALAKLEAETNTRVYTILQLRLHPRIQALKEKVEQSPPDARFQINLQYITARGSWYRYSWKGDEAKSGGLATNIGIHFFDMLTWIFGEVQSLDFHYLNETTVTGILKLEKAEISWLLSIDVDQLPNQVKTMGKQTFRSLVINGEEYDFSDGFSDLHTTSYQKIMDGEGFGIEDARPSIEIVHQIRSKK